MQISGSSRAVKIGVLSLWALALFIILFIFYIVGTNQKLFTSKYHLYMFVSNAQGLNPGAFVTLSGLKAGVVGAMQFAEKDGQQGIVVELKINRKLANKITASSVATINTMGVLGDKYVDISLGNYTDPPLQDGMYIRTAPSMELSAIAATATEAIAQFKSAVANIQTITQQVMAGSGTLGMLLTDPATQANLVQLMNNLNQISSQINRGHGNLGKFFQDSTLFISLKSTTQNLDRIAAKINQGEGSLGKMIADTSLYDRLTSISILADSLLVGLERGEGSTGKLIKDDALYHQLLSLTQALNMLTEDIKKNPKKYVTIKVF